MQIFFDANCLFKNSCYIKNGCGVFLMRIKFKFSTFPPFSGETFICFEFSNDFIVN